MSRDRQTLNLENKSFNPPRLMIAGTSGDSGKTFVALGLATTWRRKGMNIATFKKGPDYIDSAWLTLASGFSTRNLDTWMMGEEEVLRSFTSHAISDGINLIEANRGLYDGEDSRGTHSSAVMAKLLKTPIILVLPVVKVTRTAAAFVLGLMNLDKDIHIAGVILNRIGSTRHESVVRRSIEESTGIPVLGAIPKLQSELLPGRHLGLITPEEHEYAEKSVNRAADFIEKFVDLRALEAIIQDNTETLVSGPGELTEIEVNSVPDRCLRIAYFSGSAFTFYYHDNLEALMCKGVTLIPVDPLLEISLPECDGLYIGGGFPETHAAALNDNEHFNKSVKEAVETGLPVWAECGGLMFLSRSILWEDNKYCMANILPVDIEVYKKPQGHGYQSVITDSENPFLAIGMQLKGHEFHYSQVLDSGECETVMRVERGSGLGNQRDGLRYKNAVASYLHIHSIAVPAWAEGMVKAAEEYHKLKRKQ